MITRLALVICSVIMFCANIAAADATKREQSPAELIDELGKGDWHAQSLILNKLAKKKNHISQSERDWLLKRFDEAILAEPEFRKQKEKEGKSSNEITRLYNEEYARKGYYDYIFEFSRLMIELGDKRAIPSMLKGIEHYGPNISPTSVVRLCGKDGAGILLEIIDGNDKWLHSTAFWTLSVWINAPIQYEDFGISEEYAITNEGLRNRIRARFIKEIKGNGMYRDLAARGLAAFTDDDVISILEEMVLTEKEKWAREAAEAALSKIRSKKLSKPAK